MNNESKKQFGLPTTIAIIISGVIGSGIFFKADAVMDLTHSSYLTILAWVVLSVMTLLISIAFFEVQSTTSKEGHAEIGTLSNWSKKFVSTKFGTWVGIFSVYFYLPASIFSFLILGSKYIVELFSDPSAASLADGATFADQWLYVLLVIILVVSLAAFFIGINAKSFGFSKNFQLIGTIVKLLPILILVIAIPVELIIGSVVYNGNWDQMGESWTDPATATVIEEPASWVGFVTCFPLVLFTLHGFVWGGTLQKETKTRSTFKNALLISTIFVIFAYIALNSVMLSVGTESDYGIISVFAVVFDSPIVQTTLTLFIIVSILSATNAMIMYMARNINEMAKDKMLDNKKGYDQVTPQGTYKNALKHATVIIAIYFAAFVIMDLALFPWAGDVSITEFGGISMGFSDIYIMLDFLVYAIILIYAIKNRKTKHVEVEKEKSFMGSAYVSVIMTFAVVGLYFLGMFITYGETVSSALGGDGSIVIGGTEIGSPIKWNDATFDSFFSPLFSFIALAFSALIFKQISKNLSQEWAKEEELAKVKSSIEAGPSTSATIEKVAKVTTKQGTTTVGKKVDSGTPSKPKDSSLPKSTATKASQASATTTKPKTPTTKK